MGDLALLSGKYQLVTELARGGMGVIYKAEHTALGRTVAVKLLHAHYAREESFVRRFEREARAMARLEHPGIIRVYDVAADGDRRYIVMEFCEGHDLKELLKEHGPLEPLKALSITLQLAEALAYAHANGVVHRDIKPGNIMVDGQGHAKLADFGIAAATNEATLTLTGQALGTPEYMAPEQARGEPCDARSDLYSLGMVLLAMLNGATPFEGLSQVAIIGKLIAEKEDIELSLPAGVSPAVGELARALLRKKPRNRVPDAETLVQRLRRVLDAEVVEADAEQKTSAGLTTILGMRAPPRSRQQGRGRTLAVGLGVVALAALGGWGLVQYRSGKELTVPAPPPPRAEAPTPKSKIPPWERKRPESPAPATSTEPVVDRQQAEEPAPARPVADAAAEETRRAADQEEQRRTEQKKAAEQGARAEIEQKKKAEQAARAERERKAREAAESARKAERAAKQKARQRVVSATEQQRAAASTALEVMSGRLERLEREDAARDVTDELRAALNTAEEGQKLYQKGVELQEKEQFGPAAEVFGAAEQVARRARKELDAVTSLAEERGRARKEQQRRAADATRAEVARLRTGLTPLLAQLDAVRREAVTADAPARAPRLFREAEAMERSGLERLRDGKRGLRSEAFGPAREAFVEADALLGQAAELFDRARAEAARGGRP